MKNQGINKNYQLKKRETHSIDEYVEGILKGDISFLSKAITLIESNKESHRIIAEEIIDKCLPYSGNSIRIGITGVPGVGKSTFIESFGNYVTSQGKKVTVLAIDPSSQKSGGSILGDKTRMETLVNNPNAYVRPTPSKGSLGGVARKTRETIILCEAAGFDVIIIETVGVGQSETAVHSMTDFFLLLMLAGAGDELQGIKRGIMEMADSIVITKADGDNKLPAKLAWSQYQNALHLFPPNQNEWIPRVETSSSIENKGIDTVWKIIEEFQRLTISNGSFVNKRKKQASFWMYETINEELKENFYKEKTTQEKLIDLEKRVQNGTLSPFKAAHLLLGK